MFTLELAGAQSGIEKDEPFIALRKLHLQETGFGSFHFHSLFFAFINAPLAASGLGL